jgi:hypothetical protein
VSGLESKLALAGGRVIERTDDAKPSDAVDSTPRSAGHTIHPKKQPAEWRAVERFILCNTG